LAVYFWTTTQQSLSSKRGGSSTTKKGDEGYRKTGNRDYQHTDRDPARDVAVPNNTKHNERRERYASRVNPVMQIMAHFDDAIFRVNQLAIDAHRLLDFFD